MLSILKKNEKGLTLIELLAVLVIVGIIAAIAIPAIGGTISNAKTKADTASEKMVEEAAMRYLIDHDGVVPSPGGLTIPVLVNDGYLNSIPSFNDGLTRNITTTSNNGKYTAKVDEVTPPTEDPDVD